LNLSKAAPGSHGAGTRDGVFEAYYLSTVGMGTTDAEPTGEPLSDRVAAAREAAERADAVVADRMARWGRPTLRLALGIVFVWFGALKLFGVSPAADLVAATVYWFPPELFVPVLGVWEVLIGACLLYRPLIRLGVLLLFLQMPGTFLPLVLLPDVTFGTAPYALTVEGQYIVKNLVIIGAALVVGGSVRED